MTENTKNIDFTIKTAQINKIINYKYLTIIAPSYIMTAEFNEKVLVIGRGDYTPLRGFYTPS